MTDDCPLCPSGNDTACRCEGTARQNTGRSVMRSDLLAPPLGSHSPSAIRTLHIPNNRVHNEQRIVIAAEVTALLPPRGKTAPLIPLRVGDLVDPVDVHSVRHMAELSARHTARRVSNGRTRPRHQPSRHADSHSHSHHGNAPNQAHRSPLCVRALRLGDDGAGKGPTGQEHARRR